MEPSAQTKLYEYSDLFSLLIRLQNDSRLPNKFIISGKKGIGKSTFAYHFVNYLFSKDEENKYNLRNFEINKNNRSYNLVKKKTHPNFLLIDIIENKKIIDISQIRNMLEFSNKSSFNNKNKIILIDNIEYLNINSANALLKVLEEPNEKLIFILIHNSAKKILSTIKSRCIVFNKNIKSDDNIKIFEKISNKNFNQVFNEEFINPYITVGDLCTITKFSEENNLNLHDINLRDFLEIILGSSNKKYAKDLNLIIRFMQIFFYNTLLKNFSHKLFDQQSYFYQKLNNASKYNLDFDNIFLEFKNRVLNG